MTKSYRADVDGLRAVAILGVIFFHAFPAQMPGGFIGVDVFFVISGYLITSLILHDLELKRFSFARFYARRVRRLFPALLLVLTACFIFGWFDLFTDELHSLVRHISSGAAFISNFVLAREGVQEGGYFDIASDQKPLLHLWSLAVEEQFYLTWPIILVVAARSGRNIFRIALGLAALSFAYSVLTSAQYPVASFFLPFTRMWELLAGILFAIAGDRALGPRFASMRVRNWMAIAGALILAVGFYFFDKNSVYPGWRALVPVLGTVLILSAGRQAWLNRMVLAHPAVVFVGLISYPLYLWHWPLLAFARIESESYFNRWRGLILVISFFLAAMTYLFVERPIQRSAPQNLKRIAGVLVAGLLLVGGAAKLAYEKGARGPLSFEASAIADIKTIAIDQPIPGKVRLAWKFAHDQNGHPILVLPAGMTPPTAVAYGDSRARHIFNGLLPTDAGHTWSYISEGACLPLSSFPRKGISAEDPAPHCSELNQAAFAMITKSASIKLVVIAFAARIVFDTQRAYERDFPGTDGLAAVRNSMLQTLRGFTQSGKEVIFLLDNPLFFDPHRCINRILSRETFACGISLSEHMAQYKDYYKFIDDLKSESSGVTFYDPIPLLCSNDYCNMIHDHQFFFADRDHYSDVGAAFVAANLPLQKPRVRGSKEH